MQLISSLLKPFTYLSSKNLPPRPPHPTDWISASLQVFKKILENSQPYPLDAFSRDIKSIYKCMTRAYQVKYPGSNLLEDNRPLIDKNISQIFKNIINVSKRDTTQAVNDLVRSLLFQNLIIGSQETLKKGNEGNYQFFYHTYQKITFNHFPTHSLEPIFEWLTLATLSITKEEDQTIFRQVDDFPLSIKQVFLAERARIGQYMLTQFTEEDCKILIQLFQDVPLKGQSNATVEHVWNDYQQLLNKLKTKEYDYSLIARTNILTGLHYLKEKLKVSSPPDMSRKNYSPGRLVKVSVIGFGLAVTCYLYRSYNAI